MGYAMRTDRYRYVEWLDAETGRVAAAELYDHATDPDENENVTGGPENAELLTRLSVQMWKALPKPKFPLAFTRAVAPALTWHPANGQALPPSKPAGEPVSVTFVNARPDPVELVWVGPDGGQKSYATLNRDQTFVIRTRPGIVWLVRDAKGQTLGHFVVEEKPGKAARAVVPKADDKP
jgi:hypothetical protein